MHGGFIALVISSRAAANPTTAPHGHQRLDHAEQHLFHSQPSDHHGSQQPVFDLARELKLADQGHGDGLNTRHEHAHPHDAGSDDSFVTGLHHAAAR